jgi:hypothetical protein
MKKEDEISTVDVDENSSSNIDPFLLPSLLTKSEDEDELFRINYDTDDNSEKPQKILKFDSACIADSVLSPNTSCNKLINSQIRERWLHVPQKFQQAINSGDLGKIRDIVSNMFTSNCVFYTSEGGCELHGHAQVIEYYRGLLTMCPDSIFVTKNTRIIADSELIYDYYFSGTIQFRHKCQDAIFNLKPELLKNDPIKRKLLKIIQYNGTPVCTFKGFSRMIFTENLSHIQRLEFISKLTGVSRAPSLV